VVSKFDLSFHVNKQADNMNNLFQLRHTIIFQVFARNFEGDELLVELS